MKRNLSFLWLLLAAVVVFAGWFLPGFVLNRMGTPNFTMEYQTVEVSSQTSSDYVWRLKTEVRQLLYQRTSLAEPYQDTAITDRYSEEEQGLLIAQALREFRTLAEGNVFPSTVLDMMEEADSSVVVLYLFDPSTLRGFSYARFSFVLDKSGKKGGTYQAVDLVSDLSSGKIIGLCCYGFSPDQIESGYSGDTWFWHDPLRGFADYLGLGADTTENLIGEAAPEAYSYADEYTVDLLGVGSPDGSGWFELRTVLDSDGQNFSLLLYRCADGA